MCEFFFFFNDTATTEIYTLSLHDALPICFLAVRAAAQESDELGFLEKSFNKMIEEIGGTISTVQREADEVAAFAEQLAASAEELQDRKSTRLNSSHSQISYAVFCLKKKTYFVAALTSTISSEYFRESLGHPHSQIIQKHPGNNVVPTGPTEPVLGVVLVDRHVAKSS